MRYAIKTPAAIIFVDGEEFIVLDDLLDSKRLFDETVEKIGGEVALSVYKPQHKGFLRERLSITAPKKG